MRTCVIHAMKLLLKAINNIGWFILTIAILYFWIPKIFNTPNTLTAEFYLFCLMVCGLIDTVMFIVINEWWRK